MLTVKDAYEIAKNITPIIQTCCEYEKYYVFGTTVVATSCVYLVEKNTGEYSVCHFSHFTMKSMGKYIQEIDVKSLT